MAKPICLVSVFVQDIPDMSFETQMYTLQSALDDRFEDYHVLVIPAKHDQKDIIQMEVIYKRDFTLAQFDEIKEIVIERLKDINNSNNEDKTQEKPQTIY